MEMFVAVKFVIFIGALASLSDAFQTCPGHKHYEELKCTPIRDKPDDKCPSRYECPDFKALDRSVCHLNGKKYNIGNNVSTSLPTCTKSCSCDGAEDEFGFSCEFDECAEAKDKPKLHCAYQFTIDSCCSTNTVCDKDEIDKLHRCWHNGHQFVEGNLIYPTNAPCYKCLCDKNYDNNTDVSESKSCKPVDCGIELHQLNYLQLGCIPVYFDDGLCCPFEFKCPIETDLIEEIGVKSEHVCKYADRSLNIGDKIKTADQCLECSCEVPPMAQCIRTITTEKCH
ncbi:uncharacterized protein LOC116345295 [Contarinia nasturtii]|uniref:uncharacterized protein LOC116345295 n=1 Tax=Contarinia nasturtii TaxID=265458 RepID=UPI0012D46F20|nr:uncharacterized protein LOC116345295 [Contarinia nasturtii]